MLSHLYRDERFINASHDSVQLGRKPEEQKTNKRTVVDLISLQGGGEGRLKAFGTQMHPRNII